MITVNGLTKSHEVNHLYSIVEKKKEELLLEEASTQDHKEIKQPAEEQSKSPIEMLLQQDKIAKNRLDRKRKHSSDEEKKTSPNKRLKCESTQGTMHNVNQLPEEVKKHLCFLVKEQFSMKDISKMMATEIEEQKNKVKEWEKCQAEKKKDEVIHIMKICVETALEEVKKNTLLNWTLPWDASHRRVFIHYSLVTKMAQEDTEPKKHLLTIVYDIAPSWSKAVREYITRHEKT